MSEGRFARSKYEADNGDIHSIRIQPETALATLGGTVNAAPAGAVDQTISARISGGNRQLGLKARSVTVSWNEDAAPDGYDERTPARIVVLTPALYNSLGNGSTVSYNGGTGVVIGKNPERKK